MIVLAANKFFRRLKVANNAFATFDLLNDERKIDPKKSRYYLYSPNN
jgi:hypothetical protein